LLQLGNCLTGRLDLAGQIGATQNSGRSNSAIAFGHSNPTAIRAMIATPRA
jgi:hypothetical protein